MAKKIYDIVPPKVAQKLERAVKGFEKTAPKRKRTVKKPAPVLETAKKDFSYQENQKRSTAQKPKRGFPLKEIVIGGGVVVVLLGIYFYNTLAWATIKISPKTDAISFQEKITADTSYENVNLLKKIIPARLVSENAQLTQQFDATGSASNDGKATGSIKVYNKISPSAPLTLKAGTHFLSDGGKYFISLSRIVIPAMKNNVAGFVDVNIQAEESGPDYNIGASKFSVPGLSGTSYYYNIWAESKSAMAGGYTGNVKKVTKDNITGAKDVLTKKLLDDTETLLRSKISPDEILLDGGITRIVIDANANAKEGAVVANFTESVTVKVSALVFKKDDLQKFAKLDAAAQLPEGKALLEKSLEVAYTQGLVDTKSSSETINVSVKATSYYFIDNNSLIVKFTQKTASQIQDIINQEYAQKVLDTKVNFWPFWVHKAPKDKNNIKIELDIQ